MRSWTSSLQECWKKRKNLTNFINLMVSKELKKSIHLPCYNPKDTIPIQTSISFNGRLQCCVYIYIYPYMHVHFLFFPEQIITSLRDYMVRHKSPKQNYTARKRMVAEDGTRWMNENKQNGAMPWVVLGWIRWHVGWIRWHVVLILPVFFILQRALVVVFSDVGGKRTRYTGRQKLNIHEHLNTVMPHWWF